MVVDLVARLIAAHAVVGTRDGRIVCRVPAGAMLPSDLAEEVGRRKADLLAAIDGWDLDGTVRYLHSVADEQRREWEAALAHDLAAWRALSIAEEANER